MKKIFLAACVALFLALLSPLAARAAEFTATVDNNHVAEGESITLQLNLSGAEAKDAPNTEALKKSFAVVSQGQTSSTMIINGAVTSSVGWQLTLIPKETGSLTIPPVTIETSEGTLSSPEIAIDVGPSSGNSSSAGAAPPAAAPPAANAPGGFFNPFSMPFPFQGAPSQQAQQAQEPPPNKKDSRGDRVVSITASVSQNAPYQNQSIVYTAKVVARANLSDAMFQDFAVENAVVEKQGDPEVRDAVEDGMPVKIMVLHYLITPLKAGKIVIPPTVLQGTAMTAERDAFSDGFEESFKALQSLDPNRIFGDMGNFQGFNSFKPFRAKSDSIELDVKPPAAAMDNWLPLTSLDIKEERDASQPAKVGDPITRKLTLLAEGGVGAQLPKLGGSQNRKDFKVYADKPQTGESVDGKSGYIRGWRQEGYSLVPQHAGKLVLPEIRVPWWDVGKNKLSYAVLPEQVIEVQDAAGQSAAEPETAAPAAQQAASTQESPGEAPAVTAQPPVTVPAYLYGVIAALAALLLVAGSWALRLRREMRRLDAGKIGQPVGADKSSQTESLSGLEQVKTAEDLNAFLKSYGESAWGSAKNASLEGVLAGLPGARRANESVAADIAAVIEGLSGALYAGRPADIEELKTRCRRILTAAGGTKNDNQPRAEKLPKLNPN